MKNEKSKLAGTGIAAVLFTLLLQWGADQGFAVPGQIDPNVLEVAAPNLGLPVDKLSTDTYIWVKRYRWLAIAQVRVNEPQLGQPSSNYTRQVTYVFDSSAWEMNEDALLARFPKDILPEGANSEILRVDGHVVDQFWIKQFKVPDTDTPELPDKTEEKPNNLDM